MRTWASYAQRGREALLNRDYDSLDGLIDANFDLRAQIYQISRGNLEMIEAARRAGASANFAGSGGAIVGRYQGEEMFNALRREMDAIGVGVLKPQVTPAERPQADSASSRMTGA
jgi:glucuronokinase